MAESPWATNGPQDCGWRPDLIVSMAGITHTDRTDVVVAHVVEAAHRV